MQDTLRKLFYNGIGLISLTAENLQKTINQLTQDQKISLEEGKKIYDDFMKNTESKREEFEGQLGKIIEKIAKNFNFASTQEIEYLKNRIEMLEKKVEELENTKAK